jgi:hypothetical protein
MKKTNLRAAGALFALALGLVAAPPLQAQPVDVIGQWSTVQNLPITPVHMHMPATGKVTFFQYADGPYRWDPATAGTSPLAFAGYNLFCSAHAFLPDGRLFSAGGHIENGWGVPNASIYDPFSNTWTALPNMNNGRWYPSCLTLSNGEVLVISGTYNVDYDNNTLPQVWTGSGWRNLTNAQAGIDLFPAFHLAPNGKAFLSGPGQGTYYLDTSGAGAWTYVASRQFPYRGYGTSVMYDHGKVIFIGGGDPPTATAEVIDLNAANPTWRYTTGSMSAPRRQINATLLADGSVLVTGGLYGDGFNTRETAVYSAEIWNPTTERFTTMASMARPRWYHSTVVLLPDGRILSAGGDDNPSGEVFSPPYLFKGTRPTITSVPGGVTYGQTFFVGTPNAATVTRANLIRVSAVTHATNMEQRLVRTTIAAVPSGLLVTVPNNPNICPPGDYMLFLINNSGVPSVARFVNVSASGNIGTGLHTTYYNNMDFTGAALTRIDSGINFAWGTGTPDPALGADTFSARWIGQVVPKQTGFYTFYTNSDDGVRLWINGQLLVNNWTDHGPTEDSGVITLLAGQKYNLKMEFYENGGGATAELRWSGPGIPKQIISRLALFPEAGVSGSIALEDSVNPAQPITLEFRPAGGGTPLLRAVTLGANGSFRTTIPVGMYTLAIKGGKWLRRTLFLSALDHFSGVNTSLLGGDANDDNSADVLDLDLLIQTFDRCQGDAGYIAEADFNGDNCTDVLDLDILLRNFDLQGDA